MIPQESRYLRKKKNQSCLIRWNRKKFEFFINPIYLEKTSPCVASLTRSKRARSFFLFVSQISVRSRSLASKISAKINDARLLLTSSPTDSVLDFLFFFLTYHTRACVRFFGGFDVSWHVRLRVSTEYRQWREWWVEIVDNRWKFSRKFFNFWVSVGFSAELLWNICVRDLEDYQCAIYLIAIFIFVTESYLEAAGFVELL